MVGGVSMRAMVGALGVGEEEGAPLRRLRVAL
jgi:hypothetical protein